MNITFYAHASFRLETPEVSIVTDPYTPGVSGFSPIDEAADLVIMSSATDRFHSDPSHVRGEPLVVNALLDVPEEGTTIRGVPIRAFPTSESLTFDYGRDPDANAMYLLTVGGVRVLHMGDVGNPVAPAVLKSLAGQVDVLLALAGAHATIALEDLDEMIAAIDPRIVIPMHYWHPRGVLGIEPVERFLERQPEEAVIRHGATTLTVEPGQLPESRRIIVLDQAR
ncbi:MBL fold metallo-hydrolase [Roseomonas marmotae]|uniref:MBL fold metallo-hydrolase n=1 Tax=Roseomonas marmotae TaxID=2768161 RepID=A0ABS3KDE1_9PROT|nr:MBL fold metallo-hydrolase [Roseomonas marmotae]MBO1075484.1 MBL fold metallo-hydrolase [Roseomonas marmotae]QTI81431.1 MBL fold metallo-hydrolase [Roseomonas marmotae]